MKEIKTQLTMNDYGETISNIGRHPGCNYFIIPKIYDLTTYAQLFKNFQEAFGEMKNRTIHIFAAFEWDKLKMIEFCTVKQFTNMDDDEDGCEELRHFHYIQWFLYYIQSQDFAKNNRITFHCNRFPKKMKHGLRNYLFIQSNNTLFLFKFKTKIKLDTDKNGLFWFRTQDSTLLFYSIKCKENDRIITHWRYTEFKDSKKRHAVVMNISRTNKEEE